eukprot:tig00020553_g10545.t1
MAGVAAARLAAAAAPLAAPAVLGDDRVLPRPLPLPAAADGLAACAAGAGAGVGGGCAPLARAELFAAVALLFPCLRVVRACRAEPDDEPGDAVGAAPAAAGAPEEDGSASSEQEARGVEHWAASWRRASSSRHAAALASAFASAARRFWSRTPALKAARAPEGRAPVSGQAAAAARRSRAAARAPRCVASNSGSSMGSRASMHSPTRCR